MRAWLWRVIVAFDMFCNAVFNGKPDETISARAYTAMRNGKRWGCLLCRVLDLIQKDHCAQAATGDLSRASGAEQDINNAP